MRSRKSPLFLAVALVLSLPASASAGAWLDDAPLQLTTAGTAARVALGPDGGGFAVWVQKGPCANGTCTEDQIFARRLFRANNAGPAFRISPDNPVADEPRHAREPAIAVDAQGRALVAWTIRDPIENHVQVVRLDPDGDPEFPPTIISDTNTPLRPMVAVTPSGGGIVVWESKFAIEARHIPASGPPPGPPAILVDIAVPPAPIPVRR
jgi:hypothetical protein